MFFWTFSFDQNFYISELFLFRTFLYANSFSLLPFPERVGVLDREFFFWSNIFIFNFPTSFFPFRKSFLKLILTSFYVHIFFGISSFLCLFEASFILAYFSSENWSFWISNVFFSGTSFDHLFWISLFDR